MRKAMVYKKPISEREKKQKDSTSASEELASNVLAFPLSHTSGEILICKTTAHKQAKDFGMTPDTFVVYLFIHGLLHLKGYDHSATMENEECRIMKRFGLRIDE